MSQSTKPPLAARALIRAADLLADASAALLTVADRRHHPAYPDDPCPETPLSNLTARTLERIGLRAHAEGRANELSWALLVLALGNTADQSNPLRHLVTLHPGIVSRALRTGHLRLSLEAESQSVLS